MKGDTPMLNFRPRAAARPRLLAGAAGTLAIVAGLAACGSSSGSKAASSATTTTPASSNTTAAPQGVTISAANVAGVGSVLVDGSGRTLYILTSEKGGKLTCTDANGCTKVWPDTELPTGVAAATAGGGAQASMLGTVTSPEGHLYPTYAGYPLYTYTGDPGTGTANGQGITSFGGTWWVITPAGNLVTSKASAQSGTGM
jgi:predicted lipoprotein with Yx(FWY)xxD motif